MAVLTDDIDAFRYSTVDGSAGNSEEGTAAGSLGKYMSTTDMVDDSLHNLFREITAAEAEDGITLYRCIFLYNRNTTDTLASTQVHIASQEADGGSVAIALDSTGVVDHNTSAAQALEIADEETAPSGLTFSVPTSSGTALAIGNLGPQQCIGIWLRLTVPAGAAARSEDFVVLRVSGEV